MAAQGHSRRGRVKRNRPATVSSSRAGSDVVRRSPQSTNAWLVLPGCVVVVVGGAVVVGAAVVVGVAVVVVVPPPHAFVHASQQLVVAPTHAAPPFGGWHLSALFFTEHRTLPRRSTRQHVTASGLPHVDLAAQRMTSPLHVLYARRLGEHPRAKEIASLLAASSVDRVKVGPMSAGALQAITRARVARVFPRPTLPRIHEMSGGNPFYALEIARALPRDPEPSLPLAVPETLDELVRARISAMRRVIVKRSVGWVEGTGTITH